MIDKKKQLQTGLIKLMEHIEKNDICEKKGKATLPNGLTFKQTLFVEYFIASEGNSEYALKEAGYRTNHLAYADQLLNKPLVQKVLNDRIAELMLSNNISPEKVIAALAKSAFLDVRDLMSWDDKGVKLKPSSEISQHAADCIQEVTQTVAAGGHKSIKLKLLDKQKSLESLIRIMGLAQDQTLHIKHSTDDEISDAELEARLAASGVILDGVAIATSGAKVPDTEPASVTLELPEKVSD